MRMVNCRLLHIGIQLKNWNLETCVPVSHFLSRKSINKCNGLIVDAINAIFVCVVCEADLYILMLSVSGLVS